jgi:hypothetical protein
MLVILALLSAITKCEIKLCRGPQIDSICGHYVDWGGQSSDPAVILAHRSQIDVGKHREYCQLE